MAKESTKKKMSVEEAIEEANKKHGAGTIDAYENLKPIDIETFSSGSLNLDKALGIGGYPRGRIIETYGHNSSGKTTLALHAIAEAQKAGGTCVFIDAEHALDIKYAAALGVDVGKLILSQPNSGEEALDLAERMCLTEEVALIVIDSVAALVPQAEIDGEMGDSHMGLQARLLSQGLRKLTGIANSSGTTIMFLNQERMKIGVMFGSPKTTSGGEALRFYSSVRMEVARTGTVKEEDVSVGSETRVKVVKNKVAPPFTEAIFEIEYGKGINKAKEIVTAAVSLKLIEKTGAHYSYNGQRIGHGLDKALEYLEQHPEDMKAIEANVRKEW